jgi:hypothetical protein
LVPPERGTRGAGKSCRIRVHATKNATPVPEITPRGKPANQCLKLPENQAIHGLLAIDANAFAANIPIS